MESASESAANSIESLRSQYRLLDQGTGLWDVSNGIAVIIFMLIIFAVTFYGVNSLSNIAKIRKNWPEYRCSPSIMPFATFYGYDAAENFQFCMGKVFEQHSGDYTSSFTTLLRGVTGVLGTLLGSLNSMRLSIATMGGGINVIFQEFTDRIRQFFFRVRVSAIQIKQLMYRLYATFFAVIYIGLSAITGMQNLGNTALFKFLDTFCFDPTTAINVQGRGYIPIESVQIGDILLPGRETVTARFKFYANGQPMIFLPRDDYEESGQSFIKVSTNHYILNDGKWIQVGKHPRVLTTYSWMGGTKLPLICLNTDRNTITFNQTCVFADYDETAAGDAETMRTLQEKVNGVAAPVAAAESSCAHTNNFSEYSPTMSPGTRIKMKNKTSIPIESLRLGDVLSTNYKIVGILHKEITEWCYVGNNRIAASTLIWNPDKAHWKRAGEFLQVHVSPDPEIFLGLFIENSSQIELADGTFLRDYIEIFSPDSEDAYSSALEVSASDSSEE